MKNIAFLVVLAVLLFLGYQYGRPALEDLGARIGIGAAGSGTDAERCVAFAERTLEEFEAKARKWGEQPISVERWSGAYRLLEGRLQDAYDQCGCEQRSCRATDAALDSLSRLMQATNLAYRERKQYPVDEGLGRVRSSMRDARQLAEDGY